MRSWRSIRAEERTWKVKVKVFVVVVGELGAVTRKLRKWPPTDLRNNIKALCS